MKKAIVFDFGGVLVDWSPYHLYRKLLPNDTAVKAFLDEIGFTAFNPRLDCGYPFAEWEKEYSQKFPQHRELIKAFHERWTECSNGLLNDVVDILQEVKSAAYPVYGLSNWSTETFPWVSEKYTFLPYLEDYLLSGMVGTAKPGEDIYRLFLQRIDRQAEDCVFIDDSQANIDAAKRLGFTGILYRSAPELRTDLESLGVLDGKTAQP